MLTPLSRPSSILKGSQCLEPARTHSEHNIFQSAVFDRPALDRPSHSPEDKGVVRDYVSHYPPRPRHKSTPKTVYKAEEVMELVDDRTERGSYRSPRVMPSQHSGEETHVEGHLRGEVRQLQRKQEGMQR